MRLIRAYLLREILGLFALSLVIITMLFMSNRIIQLTEWAVNRGIGVPDIARMMLYLLPTVLLIIIPIVTLFSILLAVGRFSSDNEIVALKASGVSLYRLFPPVFVFALMAAGLALFSSQYLMPRAAGASRALRYRIVRTQTEAAVTPRTFTTLFNRTVFYVGDKSHTGKLKGVMAVREVRPDDGDWESRQILFARTGRFVHSASDLTNELWLGRGMMIQEDRKTGRDDFISFTTLRHLIALDLLGSKKTRKEEDRQALDVFGLHEAISELTRQGVSSKRDLAELRKLKVQFHKRLAFPLSCIALCFWAIPLGIQPPRSGRARAIVVSVILSGVFYYLMILAEFTALDGRAPPVLALWIPDLVILVTGLYMLHRKNLERPILLLSWVEDSLYYVWDKIKERRQSRSQE